MFDKTKAYDINNAENVEEPATDKYLKEDTDDGFIENKTEISRLRANRKYQVVTNKLLGDYNEDGNYEISQYIMCELIAMPKWIEKEVDGEIYAKAFYKDGTFFTFTVTKPEILPDNTAVSALKLNEEVEYANGYITDTISTIVGSYLYTYDDNYDFNRKTVFNLREKKEDITDKERTPTDYIDLKIKYLDAVEDAGAEYYARLEESYFYKRLQILNELPEGAVVLSEFNDKRKKMESYFLTGGKKSKFRALNDLLNSVLEGKSAENLIKSPQYQSAMGNLNNKYYATTEKISEKIRSAKAVKDIKSERISAETKPKGVHIVEVLGTRNERLSATVDGCVISATQENKRKAEQIKQNGKPKVQSEVKTAGGGGGKSKGGGGGKSKGGKKGGGGKGKDDKKKVVATQPYIKPEPKAPTPNLTNNQPNITQNQTIKKEATAPSPISLFKQASSTLKGEVTHLKPQLNNTTNPKNISLNREEGRTQ